MSSRTLYAQHLVSLRIFHLSPVLAYVFLSPGKSSTVQCTIFYTLQPKLMHLYTAVDSYAKNPVFEIVYEESVKVYRVHMYNGNIQQNSLCVESCVTEEFHISPLCSLHLRLPAAVAELACTQSMSIMQALSFCSLGLSCPFFSQMPQPL